MNSIDIEVIQTAVDWIDQGRSVVMGTVVRTWGSAPRPVGSLMVIRDDGQVVGSVSGGCIEDDLVYRVTTGQLKVRSPELVIYGSSADEVRRFGLPCGGTVEIVLESLSPRSEMHEVLKHIVQRRLICRSLDMVTGQVRLATACSTNRLSFDGKTLTTTHGPRYRLLIIGGGQLSRYVAAMAVMIDFQVVVCEPREEYHEGWERLQGISLSRTMPDDLVTSMKLDETCAVVAMTHDPKLDDLALMEALRTPAFYVGALGSRLNNLKRKKRLIEFDVSFDEASKLHGPIGLNIGAQTPPEIAIALMAELIAIKRGVELNVPLNKWMDSTTVCAL